MKQKRKDTAKATEQPLRKSKKNESVVLLWGLVLGLLAVTGFCLSPMLQNTFTNWDDNFYITANQMLRGPDWESIFSLSQPVVSNYHPVTILSLAFNYQLSGLEPQSYYLLNLLLHLLNTALVFYFIWLISDKKLFVAAFTALVFGIHPMHVESVAWIAERKDVLYTAFFLMSLIAYWQFIGTGKYLFYGVSYLLFMLSLLSKPAAVVLPLVLFLLDYWKGRKLSAKLVIEKIPFLLASLALGIITVQIQSKNAIVDLEQIPLWTRFFFAGYGLLAYFIRFVIPYPLSAFHPYFPLTELTLPVLFSVADVVLLGIIWYYRKNKLLVFGISFFVVNLLLVLQVVAVGSAIVAERYTYVPYIGLAFLLGMWLNGYIGETKKTLGWAVVSLIALIFGTITFGRTQVWKNSVTLWSDAISHYNQAPMPHNNRANAYIYIALQPDNATIADSLFLLAIEDCNAALAARKNHITAYENRGSAYLQLHRYNEALADGDAILKLAPNRKLGHRIRGKAYAALRQPEKALDDFNKCIVISPDDESYYNRGSVLFNQFQKYEEALADFNQAIQLNPKGLYFMTRSFCYYKLGNNEQAKADAQTALQLGQALPDSYRSSLSL